VILSLYAGVGSCGATLWKMIFIIWSHIDFKIEQQNCHENEGKARDGHYDGCRISVESG
jgi:hypothetical protein